jgi:assimilatory nitrate reductase catalytic subunit
LNTGRIRDQWHTMTRTALAPQLNVHEPEPYADLHPEDARAAGVQPGELAQLVTRWGRMVVRARCSGDIARGSTFVPMHWSDRLASNARVGALVNPVVDPISGEPEFKHTPVRVEPWTADWKAFLLTRHEIVPPERSWWVLVPGEAHSRYELAGNDARRPDAAWLRAVSGLGDEAELIEYEDPGAGTYRMALLSNGRIEACLFVATQAPLPSREWLGDLFSAGALGDEERAALLTGRAPGVRMEPGPVVCACYRVGRNQIVQAASEGHATVAAIGRCLRAGTNCGSCRPEIAQLLKACAAHRAA